MKPEDLVIGRSYRLTIDYIEETLGGEDPFLFALVTRKGLSNATYIYQKYNKETKKYDFKNHNFLINAIVGFTEKELNKLEEKPIE